MTSTPERSAVPRLPWMPTAQTGWAAKQAARTECGDCHCGTQLTSCGGCDDARCLTCDPYTSDDCRWGI
jgi:hypothetical protein